LERWTVFAIITAFMDKTPFTDHEGVQQHNLLDFLLGE
jgi:hypothetical protein